MLTTEAMIADVQDDKGDSGMGAWEWECKIPEQVFQLVCDCGLVRNVK
jgi:hypothetical protein